MNFIVPIRMAFICIYGFTNVKNAKLTELFLAICYATKITRKVNVFR